jgi:hypothetical protein
VCVCVCVCVCVKCSVVCVYSYPHVSTISHACRYMKRGFIELTYDKLMRSSERVGHAVHQVRVVCVCVSEGERECM